MSTAEKRDRCRKLHEKLATARGVEPNVKEVSTVPPGELDGLAAFYTSYTETELRLKDLLLKGVLEMDPQDLQDIVRQQIRTNSTISLKSLAFFAEAAKRLENLLAVADAIAVWQDCNISMEFAASFVDVEGTNITLKELYHVLESNRQGLTNLLSAAKDLQNVTLLLSQTRVLCQDPMTWIGVMNVVIQKRHEFDQSFLEGDTQRRLLDVSQRAFLDELEGIIHTLDCWYETLNLAEAVSSAMKSVPIPDVDRAFDVIRSVNSSSELPLMKLLEMSSDISDALGSLRVATEMIQTMLRKSRSRFPRLQLLTDAELLRFIGCGQCDDTATVTQVLPKLFCGWDGFVTEEHTITGIRGESGEYFSFIHPVQKGETLECTIGLIHNEAQRTMKEHIKNMADYSFKCLVGAVEFDARELVSLPLQASLSFLHLFWTSLVEGSCSQTEQPSGPSLGTELEILGSKKLRPISGAIRLNNLSVNPRAALTPPPVFAKKKDEKKGDKTQQRSSSAFSDISVSSVIIPRPDSRLSAAASMMLPPVQKNEHQPKSKNLTRNMSCHFSSSAVSGLLNDMLQRVLALRNEPATMSWKVEALACTLFRFLRVWEDHLMGRVSTTSVMWKRELRYYVTRGKIVVEQGTYAQDYGYEFFGNLHRGFVLNGSQHELWIKVIACLSTASPIAIVGQAGAGKTMSVEYMCSLLGIYCASVRAREAAPGALEHFVAAITKIGCFGLVLELDQVSPSRQQEIVPLPTGKKPRLIATARDSSKLHSSVEGTFRVCFAEPPDLNFTMECWIASNGFDDVVSIAKKLFLVVHLMESVAHVHIQMSDVLRAVRAGSALLQLHVQSLTSLLVLFMSLRSELEPTIPPTQQQFFNLLIQNLFHGQSSQKTFPQLEQSAVRWVERSGYYISDQLCERLLSLHHAVMEHNCENTSVVTGAAATGKSTLVQTLAEASRELSGDQVHVERIALNPHKTDAIIAQIVALLSSASTGCSMLWIVLEGVIDDKLLDIINKAPRADHVRIIYETSTTIPRFKKMILVNLNSGINDQTWTPQVSRFLDRFSKKLHDSDRRDQLHQLFNDNFRDILGACHSVERVAHIACRLVINTIAYLEGVLRMLPPNPDATVIERSFWFAVTWGCASRPISEWSEFAKCRMTSTAAPSSNIYDVGLSQTGEWQTWKSMPTAVRNPRLLPAVNVKRALFLARLVLTGEGSVAFVGPAGCGKTLTAGEIAKERIVASSAVFPPDQSGYMLDDFHVADAALQEFLKISALKRNVFVAQSAEPLDQWMPVVHFRDAISADDVQLMCEDNFSSALSNVFSTAETSGILGILSGATIVSLIHICKSLGRLSASLPYVILQVLPQRCSSAAASDELTRLVSAALSAKTEADTLALFEKGNVERLDPTSSVLSTTRVFASCGDALSTGTLQRIATLTLVLRSLSPQAILVQEYSNAFCAVQKDIVGCAVALCGFRLVLLSGADSLPSDTSDSTVVYFVQGEIDARMEQWIDGASLSNVKLVLEPQPGSWTSRFKSRFQWIETSVREEDLLLLTQELIKDADVPSLAAALHFHFFSPLRPDIGQYVASVLPLETELVDQLYQSESDIHSLASCLRFLRKVEVACLQRPVVSEAEMSYETEVTQGTLAFEGRIQFHNIPDQPCRLIATFKFSSESGKVLELADTVLFFGTSREDIFVLPTSLGGTARAKVQPEEISILFPGFEWRFENARSVESSLIGTCFEASTSLNLASISLKRNSDTSVLSRKWMRYGLEEPTLPYSTLSVPSPLPTAEQLSLSHDEFDRFVTNVAKFAKRSQEVVEGMLRHSCTIRSGMVNAAVSRTMLRFLFRFTLEERERVLSAVFAKYQLPNPLDLNQLASMMSQTPEMHEVWLIQQRRAGLPNGPFAEQNATAVQCYMQSRQNAIVIATDDTRFADWVTDFTSKREGWQLSSTPDQGCVTIVDSTQNCATYPCFINAMATQLSVARMVQWTLARPNPGSAPDLAAESALKLAALNSAECAVAKQQLVQGLREQFVQSESHGGTLVAAVQALGTASLSDLVDAVIKAQDTVASAAGHIDRQAKFRSLVDPFEPMARRVTTIVFEASRILGALNCWYSVPRLLIANMALACVASLTKGGPEVLSKNLCAQLGTMVLEEDRLVFSAAMAIETLRARGVENTLSSCMRTVRSTSAELHIAAEQEWRQAAQDAFEQFQLQAALPKKGEKQKKEAPKQLKDFLPPGIKPDFPCMTYSLWAKVMAVAESVPNLSSLPQVWQASDTGKAPSRSDKLGEWIAQPSNQIPFFEKDNNVQPVDKASLLCSLFPHRIETNLSYLVVDVFGSDFPDPQQADESSLRIAADSDSSGMIILRTAQAGSQELSVGNAIIHKFGDSDSIPSLVVAHATEPGLVVMVEAALSNGNWILIEDAEELDSQVAADLCKKMLSLARRSLPPSEVIFSMTMSEAPSDSAVLLLRLPIKRIAISGPSGVKSSMSRFYGSAGSCLERFPSHRLLFILSFLASAVAQRCRYHESGFSDPKHLSRVYEDLAAAVTALSGVDPTEIAEMWDTLRETTSTVFSSTVRDPRDKAILLAMIDWFVHPDVLSSSGIGSIAFPPLPTIESHKEALSEIPQDSFALTGLHQYAERRRAEIDGQVMLHRVELLTSHLPAMHQTLCDQAVKLLLSIPASTDWDNEISRAVQSGHVALQQLLREELSQFEQALSVVRRGLRQITESGGNVDVALSTDVFQQQTPEVWMDAFPGPRLLPQWMQKLKQREAFLRQWVSTGTPRVVNLSNLFFPRAFLAAFVFDACKESELPPESHVAKLELQQADPLPCSPLIAGVKIVGTTLDGAALDKRGALVEPDESCLLNGSVSPYDLPPLLLTVERAAISVADPQSPTASKVRSAIAFSRANAVMTRSRPSTPMLSTPACIGPVVLHPIERPQSPLRRPQYHFFAPLYQDSSRLQSKYIADIAIPSALEHNHWMIRGVVAVCRSE